MFAPHIGGAPDAIGPGARWEIGTASPPRTILDNMRGVLRKLISCPNCTLAAFGVAFAASIVVLFLVDLQGRYRDAIARAHQSARNHAEVLAADAARAFDSVDRSLRVAEIAHRAALERGGVAGAAQRPHVVLGHLQRASPTLVPIGW